MLFFSSLSNAVFYFILNRKNKNNLSTIQKSPCIIFLLMLILSEHWRVAPNFDPLTDLLPWFDIETKFRQVFHPHHLIQILSFPTGNYTYLAISDSCKRPSLFESNTWSWKEKGKVIFTSHWCDRIPFIPLCPCIQWAYPRIRHWFSWLPSEGPVGNSGNANLENQLIFYYASKYWGFAERFQMNVFSEWNEM